MFIYKEICLYYKDKRHIYMYIYKDKRHIFIYKDI